MPKVILNVGTMIYETINSVLRHAKFRLSSQDHDVTIHPQIFQIFSPAPYQSTSSFLSLNIIIWCEDIYLR